MDGRRIRKGSTDAIARWVSEHEGTIPRHGRGGVLVPFIGIKLIDLVIAGLGLA